MEITLNYLGHIVRPPTGEPKVASGRPSGIENGPTRALSINGIMRGERLAFWVSYDARRFDAGEMEALARAYRQRLQALIEHCLRQQDRVYTPSDLGDPTLDEKDLQFLDTL
jgi:non-ribosomal peptide synthase protein (TIGR01720 family)